MAATKTDKGSRQDMFANSVNSLMGGAKPISKAKEKAIDTPVKTETKEEPVETKPLQPKKKTAGRPKGVEKTQISLYLPNELLANMECATFFYKGNVTAYITALIEQDMETNKQKYDNIRMAMNMK